MSASLPEFVQPMLAKTGKAFDSDAHLFEPKWDGLRVLAFVEGGAVRLVNRRKRDVTAHYPDLMGLGRLPDGTALDGEIIVLRDGRPDFESVLSREQSRGGARIGSLLETHPAHYVAFDLLYEGHRPLLEMPLASRRDLLAATALGKQLPRLVISEGVVGPGRDYFEKACALGLEGVMAKRLDSRYLAGRRSDAWIKIKRTITAHCAILGWLSDDQGELRSLLVGTDVDGELRYVGRVGSGLTEALRSKLKTALGSGEVSTPLVPCGGEGRFVKPGFYCTVAYLERTQGGMLRAPRLIAVMLE
jgi:ATP-dependent DNA ligase